MDRGASLEDAMGQMNELSLFTGAGGGLLGSILLGWHPVGYVEWDDYCQRVIKARIEDGILPEAPIFGDIRTFISEGYAASYTGMVDVITAGFPCQPFSVAGKQRGHEDERNMWPATAECIGIVRPGYVLLENVPGIKRYLPVVVRDLRRLGYEVRRPLQLGADDVGACHRRKRAWIMAYSEGITERPGLCQNEQRRIRRGRSCDGGGEISDTKTTGLEREDATGNSCTNGRTLQFAGRDWWATEPNVGRVAHGVAYRVDRLKAIGNGQVPQVVRKAWEYLNRKHSSIIGT